MDYQNFALSTARPSTQFSALGDGFWYIDATVGVDSRIRVTPAGGATVVLRPGQHVRFEKKVESWTISNYTGDENFTGNFIVGNGDFGDSSSVVTLDGSFANNVTIMNTDGNPVPVSLPPTPIDTQQTMNYTNAWSSNSSGAGNLIIVTPAQNVNGVIIEQFALSGTISSNMVAQLLAKASPPTGMGDGDVIDQRSLVATSMVSYYRDKRVKIAAGKGVYYRTTEIDSGLFKSALLTIL